MDKNVVGRTYSSSLSTSLPPDSVVEGTMLFERGEAGAEDEGNTPEKDDDSWDHWKRFDPDQEENSDLTKAEQQAMFSEHISQIGEILAQGPPDYEPGTSGSSSPASHRLTWFRRGSKADTANSTEFEEVSPEAVHKALVNLMDHAHTQEEEAAVKGNCKTLLDGFKTLWNKLRSWEMTAAQLSSSPSETKSYKTWWDRYCHHQKVLQPSAFIGHGHHLQHILRFETKISRRFLSGLGLRPCKELLTKFIRQTDVGQGGDTQPSTLEEVRFSQEIDDSQEARVGALGTVSTVSKVSSTPGSPSELKRSGCNILQSFQEDYEALIKDVEAARKALLNDDNLRLQVAEQ